MNVSEVYGIICINLARFSIVLRDKRGSSYFYLGESTKIPASIVHFTNEDALYHICSPFCDSVQGRRGVATHLHWQY